MPATAERPLLKIGDRVYRSTRPGKTSIVDRGEWVIVGESNGWWLLKLLGTQGKRNGRTRWRRLWVRASVIWTMEEHMARELMGDA